MALAQIIRGMITERTRHAPRASRLFVGGGEMGKLVREFDWSSTSLGPIESWPASLRTAVDLVLNSSLTLLLIWGPEYVQIYNESFAKLLGDKRASTLGKNYTTYWAQAFDVMGPPFRSALAGRTALIENQRVFASRSVPEFEESFFTYSYSPVRDEDGAIAGLFLSATETTSRMLADRRTRTLHELSTGGLAAESLDDALRRCAACLADAPMDVPFALLYRVDDDLRVARLLAHTGLAPGGAASPLEIDLTREHAGWPLARVLASGASIRLDDVRSRFPNLICGPYPEPIGAACVQPILPTAHEGGFKLPAVLITGMSTRLPINSAHIGYHELLATTVSRVAASAMARETEHQRAEELASIDRAKSVFFSNISHEFRTPITLLLGPLEDELAEQSQLLTERGRARIEIAHRNALRLHKLVNALLDFSRFDAGGVTAAFELTDLAAYTSELAAMFRAAIERAGLTLTLNCQPVAGPVFVDREMWEQVVSNLLSNAFKHTFAGEIRVELRPGDHGVELEVADTGVGIPEHELPRLFERFHRVKGARARTNEGTGIGLALVQDVLRLHGGSLRVSSEEGKGSSFVATLRTGRAHLPAAQVIQSRAPGIATRSVGHTMPWLPVESAEAAVESARAPVAGHGRILWAEDNADLREYVRRLLGEHYHVTAVCDGVQALAALRASPPDLILTDVMMSELDGIELLRAVRADARTRHIPVILLSARAGPDAAIGGLNAGADDYLIKPFSARELLARVRTHLALAQIRQELTLELDRKVAERTRELQESEQKFRQLASVLHEVFWIRDAATQRMLYVSPAYERIWMRSCQNLYDDPRSWIDSVHPEDREHVAECMLKPSVAGEPFDEDFRIIRGDGAVRWLRARAFPVHDAAGQLIRVAGVAEDITERKFAESAQRDLEWQLRQSQKLEALGTLAGGIAHDFNNLLNAILGNAELAVLDLPAEHPAVTSVGEICSAGRRAKDLVERLLSFSRPQPQQLTNLQLQPVLEEVVRLMRAALPASVELRLDVGTLVPAIRGDASLIHQVVLNLTTNAWHALEGRTGCIDIRLEECRVDSSLQKTHPELRPGPHVRLSVSDTGSGIEASMLSRIFEPFFTTKSPGTGTGLGLSVVHGIVRSHGGVILVDTELGHGSTFHVYFPASSEAVEPAIVASAHEDVAPGHGERILFVDDELSLVKLGVLQLERLGYQVEAYTQPAEALAAFRADPQRYDLVVTDYNMPGLSGIELAQQLLRIRPETIVTLVTGYLRQAEIEYARELGVREILLKPFSIEEFGLSVHKLLGDMPTSRSGVSSRVTIESRP